MQHPVTLDFETEGIEDWPNYPPKPVGLAVRWPNGETQYIAWGHPKGNNGTREQAEAVLRKVWEDPMLFHNSAFDIEVARKEFGLPYPPYVEDTLFMLFLYDPHATSLSLKPSSERILGLPPDEQKDLERYIKGHIYGGKEWGAHIAKAPGDIVGPYAIGDVDRTYKLWVFLRESLMQNGMMNAYRREIDLQPILLEATRRGIRVDVDRLGEDLERYEGFLELSDMQIRGTLKAPNLNIDSNDDLANALDRAGLTQGWPLTPTGKRSTSKAALKAALKSPEMAALLAYRNTLQTCITMFMRPWLEQAGSTGRCHPAWNQVRGEEYGTRTGRLSSSRPNFQNVPNDFEGLVVPDPMPLPPQMRGYLMPAEGHSWVKRDYSQQELRVLAHFEDGSLLHAYQSNPRMDVHQYAAELIHRYTGHTFHRKQTKIVSFTLVYGGGIPALSAKLDSDAASAGVLKESYLNTFPDVRALMNDVKNRGHAKQPVRTIGGRLLYAEPPGPDGRSKAYKLMNHLIQGSSADITKQSIINWWNHPDRSPDDEFLATVHDENNTGVPQGEEARGLRVLGEAMLAVDLDVPLLSEGFMGPTWGEVEPVDEKDVPYV